MELNWNLFWDSNVDSLARKKIVTQVIGNILDWACFRHEEDPKKSGWNNGGTICEDKGVSIDELVNGKKKEVENPSDNNDNSTIYWEKGEFDHID